MGKKKRMTNWDTGKPNDSRLLLLDQSRIHQVVVANGREGEDPCGRCQTHSLLVGGGGGSECVTRHGRGAWLSRWESWSGCYVMVEEDWWCDA